jgi:aminoglycoside 2'-N-acetyltransferase I
VPDGLRLRPLDAGDADELRRIRAAPEVARWWGPPEEGFPLDDEPHQRRLVIDVGGAVAGLVQVFEEPDPMHRYAAVDLFLDPAFQRRGIGSEAVWLVTRHLIDECGHHRITIDPAVSNEAAIRACANAGFKRVGVMCRYERDPNGGGWHDGLLMEFLAQEGDVRTAHTSELDRATLAAARALLVDAFDGGFSDRDWDHTLGGVHALVWEGRDLVGHGSVVQRTLLHHGGAFRTGYVEGVAVRADRRGRDYGATIMDALERVIRGGHELGALSATEEALGFYERRGWERWQGPSSSLTPTGIIRTPDDDGAIFVLPVTAPLDMSSDLTCDWREGDVW